MSAQPADDATTQGERTAYADGDVLVDVRGIKVHFPIKRGVIFDKTIGHVYAVDGVDLAIRHGETYGLVGESGCGKSTLGRAILNLEPPTDGSVTFDGIDIASLKGEELRRKRQDIQMVFQDPLSSLDPRQSVESLLFEGMKAHGIAKNPKEARPRLVELLNAVGLPEAALAKYPHEFSGGQRQRIGIARIRQRRRDLVRGDLAGLDLLGPVAGNAVALADARDVRYAQDGPLGVALGLLAPRAARVEPATGGRIRR